MQNSGSSIRHKPNPSFTLPAWASEGYHPSRCPLNPLMLWLPFIHSEAYGASTVCWVSCEMLERRIDLTNLCPQEAPCESLWEGCGVRWLWIRRGLQKLDRKVWLGLVVATSSEVCFDLLRRGAFITKLLRRRDLPGSTVLLPAPQQTGAQHICWGCRGEDSGPAEVV